MPHISTPCPTCKKPTPHRTAGVNSQQREEDGRVYQMMECVICKTATKVYFTEGTNEFQEHLDTPDGSDEE